MLECGRRGRQNSCRAVYMNQGLVVLRNNFNATCSVNSNQSSRWSNGAYLAPPAGLLLDPRFWPTILVSHSPTRPRELWLSDRICGFPSTILRIGGSTSIEGTFSEPRGRPRRSSDGTGDPALISEPVSDLMPGVPIAVLASPKSESISSNLTPHVSGYMK